MPEISAQEAAAIVSAQASLERLRRFSHLLDNAIAIPGTSYRIGLDPILGLIPGGGDTLGLIFSSFIVIEAARLGATKSTLGRMVFNVLIEAILGAIPVIGDFFDFAWKSNQRNLKLLDEHLDLPKVSRRRNRRFVILLTLLFGLTIALWVGISIALLQWLLQVLFNI